MFLKRLYMMNQLKNVNIIDLNKQNLEKKIEDQNDT